MEGMTREVLRGIVWKRIVFRDCCVKMECLYTPRVSQCRRACVGNWGSKPNLKSAGMGRERDEACHGKSVFKTYKVDMRLCKWPRLSGLLWRDREGTIWTSRELTFFPGHHMKLGQVSRDSNYRFS